MRIYKYCGYGGIDILKNLRLKVTPPNAFNDLFEFTPTAVGAAPVKWAEACDIIENAAEIRKRLAAKGKPFVGSDEEFCDMIRQRVKEPIFASTDVVAEMCRDLIDVISKTAGIICFSKRRNNLLMWSHYANGHKGFVVGFDIPPELTPESVQYQTRRLPWNFLPESNNFAIGSEIKNLILRKSIHWRYEKEVRVLWALKGLIQEVDDQGRTCYFTKIPAKMITEVIFGYRCDREPQLELSLRSWINQNRLNVELNRAVPSDSRFALRFRAA